MVPMSAALKRYSGDIRFWIILFFVVRLYGIWFAPIELTHNWRQTTVTMVARNFLEADANPFFPRIDIAGEKSGITGMEFPLLNYLIYLCSLVFGYQHWYGRLIVLLVSSFGLHAFFSLCRKYFDGQIAFNATIVLLFSIWFTYSRKIMPDTFSMSLILFGLWHGLLYLEKYRARNLLLYAGFTILGILSKMPSAYILILLFWPFFNVQRPVQVNLLFVLASGAALLSAFGWYYIWVPYLNQTYGFTHFFMGKSISAGVAELAAHWPETISKFYDVAIKYIAFAFCLFGLWQAIKQRQKVLLYTSAAGFLAFLPVMLKGGFTFYHHSYYIIPFVPVLALLSGYGIAQIHKVRWRTVILIAIGAEGLLNHMDDFRTKPEYRALLQLEADMDRISNRGDLIVVNSGAFPTPVYFAHRKGWVAFNGELQTPAFTDTLKSKGLKYIVVMKRVFGADVLLPYQEVFNNADYRIYAASSPKP